MLFNHTKDIAIICDKSELKTNILKALELTKQIVCKRQGVRKLSHDDALEEKARLGSTKLSLFKYLNEFEDDFDFDEVWLKNLFKLANKDPKIAKDLLHKFLPKYSQDLNMTLNDARGLRSDLRVFFHCCWTSKFLLLPVYFNELPKKKLGKNGSLVEYAGDTYPEILRIIRAPFYEELDCGINITKCMPESSLSNFKWYAYKYVRSCAAWEIEDITNELLAELTENPIKGIPRTVDWYLALHASLPERVRFDKDKVFARSNVGMQGLTGKLTTANFSSLELENNPAIHKWIEELNDYVQAVKEKGIKTFEKHQTVIRKAMQVLIQSDEPIPEPKDIKRTHAKQMITFLKIGVKVTTHKESLYKLESFFDYLAMIHNGFNKPINRQIDFPVHGRSKGTVKELLPEDSFSPYLSYLYGVAEWIWYMNHHHSNKDAFINKLNSYVKKINTSESGFTPIFRCDDKYYPIEEIPTKIATTFKPRVNQECQLNFPTFLPHYIHLSILMAETGIRLIALRWLDNESYGGGVNRDLLSDRSYLISKLWVNTDKSHAAWEADVSETVIGILDRQSAWRKMFLNGLDEAIHYDGHEDSKFDMVKPLFASVDPQLQIRHSFTVIADTSYRYSFKVILTHFSYIYSKISEYHVPPVEIDHGKDLVGNLKAKGYKGTPPLDITPHSMRSQVVSNHITILPPSVIKKSTGHVDDAHVLYYAKISSKYLNAQKASQEKEFKEFLAPMMIDTKSKKSALQQAFNRNANSAMADFGAISFPDHQSKSIRNGLIIIKQKLHELDDNSNRETPLTEQLAFNSTHICPFNNECPHDIKKDAIEGLPKCGECPYSVKTVDHLPAIGAKIRALTDKAAELEVIVNDAKANGENMAAYVTDINIKRYYGGEISAWATTATCLDAMAKNLTQKDKWLIAQPDFVKEKLTKLKSSNELSNTLLRIEEALNYQEFLTPQLKAKVTLFRNKVLAQTGQFQALLDDPPTGKNLLSNFKGVIKSICDISGIGVNELPEHLDRIAMDAPKTLEGRLIISAVTTGGSNHG